MRDLKADPPDSAMKAALALIRDVKNNKYTPRDVALAIEAYRHRPPDDPPQISLKAFTAGLAIATAVGAFDQRGEPELVQVPASPDDVITQIATWIEEDEEIPEETAHARIARAARMLSKFRGRYFWAESEALRCAVEDTADALFDVLDDPNADHLDQETTMRAGVMLEAAYLSINMNGKPDKVPWILKPPKPGPDTPEPIPSAPAADDGEAGGS